jgi:hypothetical protein
MVMGGAEAAGWVVTWLGLMVYGRLDQAQGELVGILVLVGV